VSRRQKKRDWRPEKQRRAEEDEDIPAQMERIP
jgi:hypothetical protein